MIQQKISRVMGIDPGTGRMGWAIVEGNRSRQVLIACGCLETKANGKTSLRLLELYQGLEKVIEEYNPDVASVENIFFFKNAKTVISVAEARGMVITLMSLKSMEVFDYTPLQIKQTITGYGRADKQQVEMMVKSMLKMKSSIKPDDAADAVAAGLTHLIFNQMLRK